MKVSDQVSDNRLIHKELANHGVYCRVFNVRTPQEGRLVELEGVCNSFIELHGERQF